MFKYIGKWQITDGKTYFQFNDDGSYLYYNGALFGGGYEIGNSLDNELQIHLSDAPNGEIFIQGSPNPNKIVIKINSSDSKWYVKS